MYFTGWVELLMYKPWFIEAVRSKKLEASLFKRIAEEFRVSLTAAALRFAELYKGAMAVILSNNKRIAWTAYNKNFLYPRLYKNDLLPLNNRIYDIYDKLMPANYVENKILKQIGYKQFIKMKNDYLASLDKTIIVDSSDWFSNNSETEQTFFYQIDFPMRNYNSVLTVLWESEFC